jgi:hypothetical protein
LESWEPSQHSLIDTEKPRKTCAEVAGPQDLTVKKFYVLITWDFVWFSEQTANFALQSIKRLVFRTSVESV